MTDELIQFLNRQGEHFLAGHIQCPSKSPMLKVAWGLREAFSQAPPAIDVTHSLAPASHFFSAMSCHPIFNGMIPGFSPAAWQARAEQCDSPTGKKQFAAVAAYTETYDLDSAIDQAMDEKASAILGGNGYGKYHFLTPWQGHATLDYRGILQTGLPSYQCRIQQKLQATKGSEKGEFYAALTIVMEGIVTLIERSADVCARLAAEEENENAIQRLKRLELAFRQMRIGPPRDFFQALQFVHFLNAIDGFDDVGRLDQYLYPFYKRDVEAGLLDVRAAEDLLTEAFDIWGKHSFWQVVLGGRDSAGRQASNPLTLIAMDARHRVRQPLPNVSLRLCTDTPDTVLHKAFELLGDAVGHPALYNDDLYISTLERKGIPHEDATEYTFGGCTETHIAGKSAIRDTFLNMTKALEAVFYDGRASYDGVMLGTCTGAATAFSDFETFLAAYRKQAEFMIDRLAQFRNLTQPIVARLQPALIRSIFIDGCIDQGVDYSAGGATYNFAMGDLYGIPNVGNALYAVKTLVYDEKVVSMAELITALRDNYEGHEALQRRCLELPKFGNDIPAVDALVAEVFAHAFDYLQQQTFWNGDGYLGFCASAPGFHVILGKSTGATPDGRPAGTPLANAVGPEQGTDRRGPTAMLNSLNQVELSKAVGTPVVNISFRRELFATGNHKRLAALIRTFFKRGGMQLQFTVTDKDTLLDAMRNPGDHRDLMVRVSGYCARFVDLPADIQTELTERTIH